MRIPFKLSKAQLDRVSEIFGNIAVVWFSAGVVSPIISPPQILFDFLFRFLVSFVMLGIFLVLSVVLIKESKK